MGIGRLLQGLEAQEKIERRLPARKGCREIVERGNVVTGAFAEAS